MLLLLPLLACLDDPPATDCDDADVSAAPDAEERCNGRDDDCDGAVDEDAVDALPWYLDGDGDGFGAGAALHACAAPAGYVASPLDCDDGDPETAPGMLEVCDGEDDDCDGVVDTMYAEPEYGWWPDDRDWYRDEDGDGYGVSSDRVDACFAPDGYVAEAGDCDPDDPAIHPGAEELAGNRVDEDCDGVEAPRVDDADGDGASAWDDCDDADPTRSPYAAEACDGLDSNCDGIAENAACLTLADAAALAVATHGDDDALGTTAAWVGDQDGDGRDDLALGAPEDATVDDLDGSVRILAGSARGDVDATLTIRGDGTGYLGEATPARLGDVDGDGWTDLLVGDARSAWLVPGPVRADVALADALAVFTPEFEPDAVALAGGDLDGDGRGDAVVGWPDRAGGGAAVFYAPAGGPLGTADADAFVAGGGDDDAGAAVAVLGDVDGDGVGDLAVGAPNAADAGAFGDAVAVLLGPIAGTVALGEADALLVADGGWYNAGKAVGAAGDTDGDGLRDLLVLVPGEVHAGAWTGAVYAVQGRASWTGGTISAAAGGVVYGREDEVPSRMAGDGDLDGDGLADLALAQAEWGGQSGAVFLFDGPFVGARTLDDARWQALAPSWASKAGEGLAIDGDADGDGRADLLVSGGSDVADRVAFVLLGADL